jgi:hypothetical protein
MSEAKPPAVLGHWRAVWLYSGEPYELRGSRSVLRGRGGEIPPRYSPSGLHNSSQAGHYDRVALALLTGEFREFSGIFGTFA